MRKFIMVLMLAAVCRTQAHVGAISSSTAESGRASAEPSDAPYMNPASLSFLRGYYFTTGYSASANSPGSQGREFSLALIDNMPDTVVPTSLAFTQSKENFASEEVVGSDLQLGVGNYIGKSWAGGLGVRYRDNRVPHDRFTQTNVSLSTLYLPTPEWGFAAILDNVLGANGSVPEDVRLRPETSVGTSYIYKRLVRTRLDLISASNNSWDQPTVAGGLEMFMNKWVILRIGAQRNQELQATAYAAGVGFVGPNFGIHYAYFKSPDQESLTRHALDLAVPIW